VFQAALAHSRRRTKSSSHAESGLLEIDLVREVPEAMKPRRIQIKSGVAGTDNQQIVHKQAA